ncbi:MAG: hypothetical protein JW759_08345 [Candidatus Coatesbacteria bacterium]|nr:hypothetical protein [Candidatus Coatesbacteria bacterium]
MKCPNCGVMNDEAALRCDCGYDFQSNGVKEPDLSIEEQRDEELTRKRRKYKRNAWICLALSLVVFLACRRMHVTGVAVDVFATGLFFGAGVFTLKAGQRPRLIIVIVIPLVALIILGVYLYCVLNPCP